MKSNRPVDNVSSVLLSQDENELIFRLLGPRCSTLATAVMQLFTTDAPGHDKWLKRHTGVLCFVKDGMKRSYFFRIYCPLKKTLIWEHEIYNEIKYLCVRSFFHTFEGEDSMVGFSFANEEEAIKIISAVQSKLESRQRRREERKARLSANKMSGGDSAVDFREKRTSPETPNGYNYKPPVMQLSESSLKNKNKLPRGKFRKEDIGQPENFRHVFHVGPDSQDKVDETLKEFFHKVGISDTHLRDEKTRTFIYDFISDHGGMDAVKQEVETKPTQQNEQQQMLRPPPIPSRTTPVNRRTPPPPPSRVTASASGAPPTPPAAPPARPPAVRPPPPSATAAPPPPPLPVVQPSAAPPPPPPPIDGLLNNMPTPKSPSGGNENNNSYLASNLSNLNSNKNSAPAVPDPRAALLDSIRNAPTLRKVQVEPKAPISDSRSNLLSEIRGGIELKSVPVNANQKTEERPMDGLAGALAKALMARQIAINPDTDSSDNDTISDEDDWI